MEKKGETRMVKQAKETVKVLLRFIFRQLNKLASHPWVTPLFGDVAYVFGKGPCERCVGRKVSIRIFSDDEFGDKTGHVEVLTNLEYLELESLRKEWKAKRRNK